MRDWVIKLILEQLAKRLTRGMVEEWAAKVQGIIIPWLHAQKDKLIEGLKVEAAKTDTTVDDKAVEALDWFLTALLPEQAKLMASCMPPCEGDQTA